MKIKTAIIGIGRIGMLLEEDPKRVKPATHFGMWTKHQHTELVGVCDTNTKNLEKAKLLLSSVNIYTDAKTMLKELQPKIVSIATWKDTHYDMLKLCIEYNIPVIVCEKPICEKIEHGKEIEKLAKEKGIKIIVNHRRRFDNKLYPFIKDLKKGLIGKIYQGNIYYVFGLYATGTHMIDTIRFFIKDIVGDIKSVIGIKNNFNHFSFIGDPSIDAIIEFENGLNIYMQCLNMKDYDIHDIHLYGSKGKIEFTQIGRSIKINKVVESPEHKGFTELQKDPEYYLDESPRLQFKNLADNAIDCLDGGNPLNTIEDSVIALKILHAIEKSANNNNIRVYI